MRQHNIKGRGLILLLVLALLASSAGATYAWFTYNRVTETNIATARTGEDRVELYISSGSGGSFREEKTADIIQVNESDAKRLMPVSTADLKTFVYAPNTQGSVADVFAVDDKGANYYHGRVYVKAQAAGNASGKSMDLYFDTSQEGIAAPVTSAQSGILKASRLGLTFDGGSPVIFYLDNGKLDNEEEKIVTVVNGRELNDREVLSASGGNIHPENDPSVSVADYTIALSDGGASLPANKLFTMELNKEYAVDIYFYLEGCDPDCTASVGLNEVDMQLAFYGVLN